MVWRNLYNGQFRHLRAGSGWQFYCDLVAKLNDDQLSHLRTINWLLGDKNRNSGRSLLMAIGFIREVLRTGGAIEFFDHSGPDMRKQTSLERTLENLISTNRFARENFTVTARKLHYKDPTHSPEPNFLTGELPKTQPPSGLIEDIIAIITLAKQRGVPEEEIREAVDLSLVGDLMTS